MWSCFRMSTLSRSVKTTGEYFKSAVITVLLSGDGALRGDDIDCGGADFVHGHDTLVVKLPVVTRKRSPPETPWGMHGATHNGVLAIGKTELIYHDGL